MTKDEIEISAEDAYAKHAADLTRLRYRPGEFFSRTWPRLDAELHRIVGKVNGVPAGRGSLEAAFYPFAEFVNLEVAAPFRGRGVGSGILARAMKQAAEMGFYAIHLQADLDNNASHRLYVRHGFLPVTQGKMLKLVRILNHPALFRFLHEHPFAQFASRQGQSAGLPRWEMSWTDPLGDARFGASLHGGSSDKDSDDFGPALCAFDFTAGAIDVRAELTGAPEVARGEAFDVEVRVSNRGQEGLAGACRLVLNAGLSPGSREGADFCAEPDSSHTLTLPVRVDDDFDDEALGKCMFPSVSTVVEVIIGDSIVWLNCQHKIRAR